MNKNEYYGTHKGKLNAIVNSGRIALLNIDLDTAVNV